jgi:hypothetical protein
VLCAFLALVVVPARAEGQQRVRIRQETGFHANPGGTRLGTLVAGNLALVRSRAAWREVALEAWIWTASLGPTTQDGFNVVVTSPEGQNLRLAPNGDRVGRALDGARFTRVRRQGGWTLVRRRVWVPATDRTGTPPRPADPATARPRPTDSTTPPPNPTEPTSSPLNLAAMVSAPRPSGEFREPVVVGKGTRLFTGPGSEEIGEVQRELLAEVVERSSGWVKIRLDAWVRDPNVSPAPLRGEDTITLEALRTDPARFVGRAVTWRLQYLSLQVADELRPEIPAGQTYLLARGPLPEAGFVYVVVSREQAERFRGVQPLTEFVAQGRILAARTRYLPTPVIQLERLP